MPDMPGMGGMDMASPALPEWSLGFLALIIAMWWVMMIAMMTPSAAPAILLYARAYRHAQTQDQTRSAAPTGAFAAGYLLVWLGFSVLGALLHWALERGGVISPMTMGSQSKWLSAGVLAAAGAYQLSPLKHACLSYCRGAAEFLTRHWLRGATGALRMGVLHGAYCVGCCWALMALLFVGGVMNLAWIGALAVLVLAEKLAPGGVWMSRGAGAVLLLWALATLLV